MTIILSEYELICTIHEDTNTVIYRGFKLPDQTPVIIKTLKADYPSLEQITRLRHEYKILQVLDIEGVVKPYTLLNYKNGLALILSDFGGDSLKNFISTRKVSLLDFLKIGIQLASSLSILHQNHIIHKDIKPHNILIDSKTGQVKITDFSIATLLCTESAASSNPNLLEGTLAYISPEQTGRMNRSIDYRADFYCLGITFYEMLTSHLPFNTTDPLELIHCHIAKNPVPPSSLNSEIPEVVSDVVMKLLSKNAEDRYQSGLGLKADLETCLSQILANGKIEYFSPGQQDFFAQFFIPQKLYGRDREVANLMEAFERVTSGSTEMMLVSGYSGIGKSSLVNEIHKPILRQRGYFISGKFDQFKRNIPYLSVIQAFQSLMRQLLTESPEKLAIWKSQLLDAFGQNGQIIIDVIPEVELIVGKQPDVPQLGPAESQNRFNRVFKQFIHVFTRPEHPLVLFLDDLQWADFASLKLIQLLMTDPDSQYLFLIGAYRDNEVSAAHPLMITLDEIKKSGAIVNNITLQPLDIYHVSQLVADTLRENHSQAESMGISSKPLAELVFNKTQGNPFFLNQLLQSLHQEKLLVFDFATCRWQWDIAQIQAIGITDYNVVELIARNIQKLPDATQNVLKLAACIGNIFNLDVLAIVNEKSHSETAADLWDALQAGLVLPLSEAYKIPLVISEKEAAVSGFKQVVTDKEHLTIYYKFLHDRVQQAAYFLIAEFDKKQTHFKIGQLLLKHLTPNEIEEKVFDIINQLNVGVELLAQQSQKDELARLNLIAGRKAKAAMAYESAVRYLNIGLELLAESSWESNYQLTLDLYVEAVEAEYLSTHYERAETLSEIVMKQAKKILDKVPVYEVKIQFYITQNKMQAALNTGLEVLKYLGISLPQKPNKISLLAETIKIKWLVNIKGVEQLAQLPKMTDPYKLAAERILTSLSSVTYITNPYLYLILSFKRINFCLKYGNSPLSALAYINYGCILIVNKGDIDLGYRFCQLALTLLKEYNNIEIKAKLYAQFNACARHWKEHTRETIEAALDGMQSGLEVGDIEFACYNAVTYCYHQFFAGYPLESVDEKYVQNLDVLFRFKHYYSILYLKTWRQVALNLMGKAANKYRLIGEDFNEDEVRQELLSENNLHLFSGLCVAKATLLYFLRDYEESVANASLADKNAASILGFMMLAQNNFYYSLAILALYLNAEKDEQIKYMNKVVSNQKIMKSWAYHAPSNYKHKYDLVEAEKARVLGKDVLAVEYYERAIEGAKKQGYIQEEALANELAAEFYLSRRKEKIAIVYMTEAYYGYIRWGALAKVRDLESRYPQLISRTPKLESTNIDVTQTTTSTTGSNAVALDFAAAIAASQALAGEIFIEKLLYKLMKTVIESAGAQIALLILKKDGKLMIEAKAFVDKDKVIVLPSICEENHSQIRLPVASSDGVPVSVVNYVERTQENVVLNDASCEGIFASDPYILKSKPKSVLCTPLIHQGKFIGILYLENNLARSAFTRDRIEILKLLSAQAAISIENAKLVADLSATTENLKMAKEKLEEYSQLLENKVEQRTLELQEKNELLNKEIGDRIEVEKALRQSELLLRAKAEQLEEALHNLKQTQTQLIQREKMSSLGQLVAGVAHEINNPVNFIYGNISFASEYSENMIEMLNLYAEKFPNPGPEIEAKIAATDLEFFISDLPKILVSMRIGAERIREIVQSLRNFSRLDEAEMKPVNIHDGLDSTLLILHNRFKAKPEHPSIQLIKEYGELPPVECYAGQLNQVFMNILSNAIDSLESRFANDSLEMETGISTPTIRIRTEIINNYSVAIRIADNGPGMTEDVRQRLFDPFFTTKPVGKGTGLGLSISYQIVVEKHGGQLKCLSAPGEGAEFIIEIPLRQQHQKVGRGKI